MARVSVAVDSGVDGVQTRLHRWKKKEKKGEKEEGAKLDAIAKQQRVPGALFRVHALFSLPYLSLSL